MLRTRHLYIVDCMTSWVVTRHLRTDTLDGSLGGICFVVKIDINQNQISAVEKNASAIGLVQIAVAKTVFTT